MNGPTVEISGSDGDGKTRFHYRAISGRARYEPQRPSRCPVQLVVGCQ
ncbi:MAG TPA: hypothetical protein VJL59_25890 [Anaerolineales bacterium]|nr:hypothetical protein [Anaerolineales bacterium]